MCETRGHDFLRDALSLCISDLTLLPAAPAAKSVHFRGFLCDVVPKWEATKPEETIVLLQVS